MEELRFQTLREIIAEPMSTPRFVIGSWLLPEGGNMILYGKQGSWKSWMAIAAAVAVSTGRPWLERYETEMGRVMVIQTEQPRPMYRHRLISYTRHLGTILPDNLVICTSLDLRIDTPHGAASVKQAVEAFKPTLVILDDVYHLMSNPTKEEVSIRRYIDVVDGIRAVSSAAWLHVHHPRKAEFEEGLSSDELYGSALFGWWADTIVRAVAGGRRDDKHVVLEFQKVRNAEEEVGDVKVWIDSERLEFAVR